MAKAKARTAVDRERARRECASRDQPAATAATPAAHGSRRAAAQSCAWCGASIEPKTRGRIPKWCSPACRQRAWEQRRATESGRAAVEVVERVVQAPATPTAAPRAPQHGEWAGVLRELAAQVRTGRIYARDLPGLYNALTEVGDALSHSTAARTARRH